MAATYRSSTTANTGATTAASVTLTLPSGYQVNDNLVVGIAVAGGSGATVTTPSGWTSQGTVSEGTDVQMHTFWRLANGQEAASYTFTLDSARMASGVMAAYSAGDLFFPGDFYTSTLTTASTSVPNPPGNNTYSGTFVTFFATENTTGAASFSSASGGFTLRADTCTTASPYIEAAIQDKYVGFPEGGSGSNAATNTQSVVAAKSAFMVKDYHGTYAPLVEDVVAAASWSSSLTNANTPSFQTNYPNELVLCIVTLDQSSNTVTGMTGGSLTWTNVLRANTNSGSCEVWYAWVPTPKGAFTNNMTFSGSVPSGAFITAGLVGADSTSGNGSSAFGATATGTSSSAAPTINLTTTRNNSWVYTAMNDPQHSSTLTIGSNQTMFRTINDATSGSCSAIGRQTALTPAAGTVVASNWTSPSVDSCNILAIEILPRITHELGAAGAGS